MTIRAILIGYNHYLADRTDLRPCFSFDQAIKELEEAQAIAARAIINQKELAFWQKRLNDQVEYVNQLTFKGAMPITPKGKERLDEIMASAMKVMDNICGELQARESGEI